MQKNTKILIIVFTILAIIAVISSVTVAFVIKDKNNNSVQDATGEEMTRLRTLMAGTSLGFEPLFAYIIPTDDAHQSEYIAPHDRRREFITGFTGSAGTAVVTATKALLWTDGRYFEQAENQLHENWDLMKNGLAGVPTMAQWLQQNCQSGERIGVDARLMSTRAWNSLAAAVQTQGCIMTVVKENLVDLVWDDQPTQPHNPLITLDVKYAGKLADQKLIEIREKMSAQGAKVLVITALDEVAHLFNLRGSDIDYNPVFFAYVIITETEVQLFTEPSRITDEIKAHFVTNKIEVTVKNYDDIATDLETLANQVEGKVWVSATSSYLMTELVPIAKRVTSITPIQVMKAIKNEVEAQGMVNCHIQDGLALVKYFAWLENELTNDRVVTEISGADKLEEFRSKGANYMGLSFETIAGSGEHGSIIHYIATPETDKAITLNEMYMCDSGGQYNDGTTDVTRTWHFGTPTDFQREAFTRVFKGQWMLGHQVFPDKTKGRAFDTLARSFLWNYGLDYAHGTSHGIGHFLNVHEGPFGIGTADYTDDPGFQTNMFMSNEPGYYKEGEFGIRLEDIVQVVPADVPFDFNGIGARTFFTVTLCPIHLKLIKVELLTEAERAGLNAYHKRVFDTLSPLLDPTDELTLNWLRKETNPI